MRNNVKTVAIAAIVSLGIGASSATAASMIGSSQIKDNSVQSRDIKNGTLSTADLSAAARAELKGNQGPAGPAGKSGANGANGIQGPAGGFDPAKVTYVEGPTVTVTPDDAGTSVAKCAPNTKAVGGGYFFGYLNGGITVEMSAPLEDGSGWIAGFGNGGVSEGEATAYAVCAAK